MIYLFLYILFGFILVPLHKKLTGKSLSLYLSGNKFVLCYAYLGIIVFNILNFFSLFLYFDMLSDGGDYDIIITILYILYFIFAGLNISVHFLIRNLI